jgi:glycosyltransferase involved in cell wall biosynthesis
MRRPLVSVIIPTYNRSGLLGRAVRSVLQQNFNDLEILIIDDSSDDDTQSVVNNLNDGRVRYFRNKLNIGGSGARNVGISQAKGKYLAFLDDDDEWLLNKLEKQVSLIEAADRTVGLVYCGYYYIYNERRAAESVPRYRGDIYNILLKNNVLGSPTPLIRNEVFREVGGFDERLPSCQDWDMWIRISRSFTFDYVSESLANHHIYGNQISTNLGKKIIARKLLIDKYRDELHQRAKALGWHYRRLGSLYSLYGDVILGRKSILRSIQSNPFNFGSYIHLLLITVSPLIHRRVVEKYGFRKIEDITLSY